MPRGKKSTAAATAPAAEPAPPSQKRPVGRPRKVQIPDVASAFDRAKRSRKEEPPPIEIPPGATAAEKVRAVRNFINKYNGREGLVATVPELASTPYHIRRPCGVANLDVQLGGGMPAGTMVRYGGPDGGGKTTLGHLHIRAHQEIYGPESCVAIASTEYLPDYDYMQQLGVKIAIPSNIVNEREAENTARGLPPFTPEARASMMSQVGEIILLFGAPGEVMLTSILDLVRRDIAGIILIDSMSVLSPTDEQEKSLEDPARMAARAALVSRFQTQLHYALLQPSPWGKRRNQTTVIEIDQVRANKERATAPSHLQKFIPEYRLSTDWASNHGAAITVVVRQGEKIRQRVPTSQRSFGDKSTMVTGRELQWHITKGKYGVHENLQGSVPFMYDIPSRIDLEDTVVQVGMAQGIIHEKDGALHVVDSRDNPIGVYGSPEEFKELLRADTNFNWMFRKELVYRSGASQCCFK